MRKELTDEWKARGITKEKEYAILTNDMTRAWSGMSVQEYKQMKGLKKESLRDIAKEGGSVAKNAREDIESRLGHSILSESNASDKKALDIKPELAE